MYHPSLNQKISQKSHTLFFMQDHIDKLIYFSIFNLILNGKV